MLAPLVALLICLGAAGAGPALAEPRRLDAVEAYNRAEAGKLLLVDIRTPEEWRSTGVAEPAITISMMDRGFLQKLDAALGGDRDAPFALICATGGRSAIVARALENYGYSRVHDVSEGMSGSPMGPGWLARKMPLRKPD
ncbi:rhodanese-like domain-containing protein [Tepidamorphus sp. 3E244]|uniref:rhodanese-like domain-containing protein n=1 Tax=Tepidamorphus sp. 3E244 TaxID=3385498 RepID=UPI0038FC54AE